MDWADALVGSLIVPLAVAAVVSGIDDLMLDLALAWEVLREKRRRRGDSCEQPYGHVEKPIAVLVPLWREEKVIGRMLERNLGAIRYANYHIFAGVYPNDPGTMAVVREAEERFERVHMAIVPHDGPTSKADCLNWTYQAMRAYEEATGERFEIVVVHDAEDLIHPDGLAWINALCERYDMVQVPVLPLPTPASKLTHGVYCDEFAEFQLKDVRVRTRLGGFLPSNGVGTGYRRRALETLAWADRNQIFDPWCQTEDYDCGLRLHRKGFSQYFLPVRFEAGEPVATREYFPMRIRQAIRQRTRWVTGICLQSWEKHGWRGGPACWYWFWRDRKGLVGNPLSLVGNLVCLYGGLTWLWSQCTGAAWGLKSQLEGEVVSCLWWAALGFQVHRLAVRMSCSMKIYGWKFGLGVPVRAVWANWINALATGAAFVRYLRARWLDLPLVWLKTEHTYPATSAVPEGGAMAALAGIAGAVERNAVRALPLHVVERWRALPVRIQRGELHVVAPRDPGSGFLKQLGRHTYLEVKVHVVGEKAFRELLLQAAAYGVKVQAGAEEAQPARSRTRWRPCQR